MEEDANVVSANLINNEEQVVKDGDYISSRNLDNPAAPAVALPDPAFPAPVDPLAPPDPEPVAGPIPSADPPTQALARILEVVPNIDPEFLYPLIATHLPTFGDDPTRTVEYILGVIFEMGDKVPKIKGNSKGKRKSEGNRGEGKEQDANDDERKEKRVKVDWASADRPFRGTEKYLDLALVLHFMGS
jgi:TRIAD3 protein (E3 ubiquitin-protein ligase RNF216)